MSSKYALLALCTLASAAVAGPAQAPLTKAEIDACVAGGVLTNEQADQLSGARTPHAEYRTELQRLEHECEAYAQLPEPDRRAEAKPRSPREDRMMQGAATPYPEYRTSYSRLSAEEARKAAEGEAEEAE